MDILIGKVSEASTGSGGANPPGTMVGQVLFVRAARKNYTPRPGQAPERGRGRVRSDPPGSIVVTLLVTNPTALQGRLESGVSRIAIRLLPRSR